MAAIDKRNSDDVLMDLLVENKTLIGFFHAIFGFLARKTDFYYVTKENGENMGLPPGVAEELVVKMLRKCNPHATGVDSNRLSDNNFQHITPNTFLPTLIAEEVEITTTEDEHSNKDMSLNEFNVEYPIVEENNCNILKNITNDKQSDVTNSNPILNTIISDSISSELKMQSLNIDGESPKEIQTQTDSLKILSSIGRHDEVTPRVPAPSGQAYIEKKTRNKSESKYKASEAYNGAITDGYSWSQTMCELDVTIKLPDGVKKSKQLKINITSNGMSVQYSISQDWITLVKDNFSYNIKQAETVWLMSEGYIRIHLEKQKEIWWHALLQSEPAIDTSTLNCSRPLHELPEEHLEKVRELQHNQMLKMSGKPTSDDVRNREMLKKAWNEPGSPFAGVEFDPNMPIAK